MELQRWIKHYNRGALFASIALFAMLAINAFISYSVKESFNLVEYVFTAGLPGICIFIGIMVAVIGANYLVNAAAKGKIK